jgi:cleavage and polyadenylation specificity factor subunit 1
MQTLIQSSLPPSGHEHAVALQLTKETLLPWTRVLRQLVLARTNHLQIFDVLSTGQLCHRRSQLCHGHITGLARVKTLDSTNDGLHRLLISFKSAKLTLMEWSHDLNELIPISLHSYERLPQIQVSRPLRVTSHRACRNSSPRRT